MSETEIQQSLCDKHNRQIRDREFKTTAQWALSRNLNIGDEFVEITEAEEACMSIGRVIEKGEEGSVRVVYSYQDKDEEPFTLVGDFMVLRIHRGA